MSASILEVIEAGGYNLETLEDANWLLAQRNQFDELVEKAEELVDAEAEKESERAEQEYRETFPEEQS